MGNWIILVLLIVSVLVSVFSYVISSWIILKNSSKQNKKRKLKWIKGNKKRKHPKKRTW